jgi:hypothetical protein
VRAHDDRYDAELASLAHETRLVADIITETAIRHRLIEIADEISELAFPVETSD